MNISPVVVVVGGGSSSFAVKVELCNFSPRVFLLWSDRFNSSSFLKFSCVCTSSFIPFFKDLKLNFKLSQSGKNHDSLFVVYCRTLPSLHSGVFYVYWNDLRCCCCCCQEKLTLCLTGLKFYERFSVTQSCCYC